MGRELPQGRRVGNYAVERLLARGGLWSAYLARQTRTERLCTLTVFHLDPEDEPWLRFRRELEQLAHLRHPSLLEVLDLNVAHDGAPYQVTEHLDGHDLGARLRGSGALTLPDALGVIRQVGAALHAGHGVGILHRDVRPGNVLLIPPKRADDFLRAKLLGAGVGRLLESTVSGLALVGDPDYMAPEQILSHPSQLDPRADQFSLAVLLYHALTTSRPFHGDSVGATLAQVTRGDAEPLRALRPDVPEGVEAAVTRAMSRDREARFPDLQAFLQALQEGVPLPLGMAELTEPWLSPPADVEAARRLVLATGAEPAAPLSLGVSAALELAARSGPSALGARHADDEPEAHGPAQAHGHGGPAQAHRHDGPAQAHGHDGPAAAPPHERPSAEAGAPAAPHERPVSGQSAVPQPMGEEAPATLPHSMQDVMRLAVPPPAAGAEEGAVTSEAGADATLRTASGPPVTQEDEDLGALEIVAEYTEDGRPVPQVGETEVVTRPYRSGDPLPSIIVDLPTRPVTDGDRLPPGVAAPNDATRASPHLRGDGPADLLGRLRDQMERRANLAERLGWALVGACAGGILMRLLS